MIMGANTRDENWEMIQDSMERETKLTEWEWNFLESVEEQMSQNRNMLLTTNQETVLEKIWTKVTKDG